MSTNKMVVPGFGVGAALGVPTTIALAETSTLSITSALVGAYYLANMATGTHFRLQSTANGITASYTILQGVSGHVWLDGASGFLVNTTTSIQVIAIGT